MGPANKGKESEKMYVVVASLVAQAGGLPAI